MKERRNPCERCPILEKLGYCPISGPGLRYCPYMGTDLDTS